MISNVDSSAEQFLANLSRIQAFTTKAQNEVSSGYKVTNASDAPDQISQLLQLESDLAGNSQITTNLGQVKTEVDTADQTIGSALQLVDQATTYGTQGANGTQTASSRLVLAQQIQGIQEQIVGLSQTAVGGRFIFSGDNDQSPQYQLDLTQPNGVSRQFVTSATRQIVDPNGSSFVAGKTAQDLFDHRNSDDSLAPDNLFAALNNLRLALTNNDQAGITTALASLRTASSYVNSQEAFYGQAQNRITNAIDLASSKNLSLKSQISAIRDVDLASASLDLNTGQVDLQAALAARGKYPKTSLFNYLG